MSRSNCSVTVALLLTAGLMAIFGCADDKAPPPSDESTPTVGLDQPAGHQRMVAVLEDLAVRSPDENSYQGDGRARRLRAAIKNLPTDAPVKQRLWLLRHSGMAELRAGNETESIRVLTEASRLLPRARGQINRLQAADILFRLGVAYMRLGETENCCNHFTPDSCIMPIRGGGIHKDPTGSRGAIRLFKEVTRMLPADNDMHLTARWLMNVAFMTLDEYPDKVPAEHLIPRARFNSVVDFPRLMNVAQDLGLARFNCSGGVIIDDLTGDGEPDILNSTWEPRGALKLFTRDSSGKYTDRSAGMGLKGIVGGLNLVPADYDNDGDLDFVVLRGAWLGEDGRHPNSLVRNNGDGTFTDVTFDAGLGEVHYPTQTADWADYDGDGDLDLFIGNETLKESLASAQLFQNQGDGTFKDVAARAGVLNNRFTKSVCWGDYDNDGDPDLFISNFFQENRLYRNQGDGTFVDVAPDLGVTLPLISFPTWFWDYNNDGNLDIFVSTYDGRTAQVARHYLGQQPTSEPACLYRGDGKGGFTNVAGEAGLMMPMLPMGANFGDLDGDGFLDIYLGTGDPDYASLMPNLLLMNQQGQRFVDVTMAGGVGLLQKGHGVAFADIDGDGDIDLFEQMGGAYIGDRFRDAVFENPGFGNRQVTVHCIGTRSNRSAIGARIRVDAEGPGGRRTVYRHVNTGGSFGANPLRKTIGLGKAERILAVEVYWPTSGITQRTENVPLDALVRVTEGAEDAGDITIGKVPRRF
ncbi:MAG: CRTAC1 family protein [Candidatus Krumholzibacteria bacterium]|nr:CRTAC1 family protein [Candidatus Krumholzibacteria bacterium]